jgi:hypothetical protein
VAASIPPDVKDAVEAKAFQLNQTDHAQGHILPDVETWLREDLAAAIEGSRGTGALTE